jgi:hypothetical protein
VQYGESMEHHYHWNSKLKSGISAVKRKYVKNNKMKANEEMKRLECEVKTKPVDAEDLYSKRNFLLL